MLMSSLRTWIEAELGILLQESRVPGGDLAAYCPEPRPAGEIAGLCRWTWAEDWLQVHVEDAALLALPQGTPRGERGAQLQALERDLGAELQSPLRYRELWLELERAQHWRERRPPLARQALLRVAQGLDRVYEREALAGDQERPDRFAKLAELAALARTMAAFEGS